MSWPKAKNALAEGQSSPQELEVSPRSGLYLLVDNIHGYTWIYKRVQLIYHTKGLSGQVRKILYPLKTYTIYRKLKYNIH